MRYSEYMGDYSIDLEGEVDEVIEVLKYLDKQGISRQFDKELEKVAELAKDTRKIAKEMKEDKLLEKVTKGL